MAASRSWPGGSDLSRFASEIFIFSVWSSSRCAACIFADITSPNKEATPGHIRGYDVRTGKLVWTRPAMRTMRRAA